MLPIESNTAPTIKFNLETERSKKFNSHAAKIAWLHSFSSERVKFDIQIKDSLGHVRYEKKGAEVSGRGGELINLPVRLGEELELSLDNVQGSKNIEFFIN